MTVTVTRENLASCQCKLNIEVDVATVNAAREAAIRDVRRQVTLPGFRKGKAPRKLIERKYADTIQSEVVQRVVSQAYREALEQEHIHPLSDPDLEDVEFEDQKPVKFSATLDVRPEVELGEYTGLELTQPPADVDPHEVEEVLESLQERHADFTPDPKRAAAVGDVLVVDFALSLDGEPIEGGTAEGYTVELGKGALLPGFEDNLQGRTAGEEVDFDVTFPEDYQRRDLAGKTAQAHATINEVKLKSLPPIDDEFAKDVGEVDTLAELRDKITDDIRRYKTSQGESRLRDQAMERLLERAHVDVPARLHERARLSIIRDHEQRMKQAGATEAQIAERREELMQHASEQAAQQIKSSFVLEALAEREGLYATEDDVNRRIEELASRQGLDVKTVRQHFSNPDQRSSLRQQLQVEKVLDFLIEHATITPAEPAESGAATESE